MNSNTKDQKIFVKEIVIQLNLILVWKSMSVKPLIDEIDIKGLKWIALLILLLINWLYVWWTELVILGNKSDLSDKMIVPYEDAKKFAKVIQILTNHQAINILLINLKLLWTHSQ